MMTIRDYIAKTIKEADTRYFYEDYGGQADAVIAALERAGLIMVPKEATAAMMQAGVESLEYGTVKQGSVIRAIYEAMVEKRPQTGRSLGPLVLVGHLVARGRRQRNGQAVKLVGNDDLAPEAGRLRKAEREVEHIFLVLGGFGQAFKIFGMDDDVAGRARQRAFAGAFEIDPVPVSDLKYRQSNRSVHFMTLSFGVDERHSRHRNPHGPMKGTRFSRCRGRPQCWRWVCPIERAAQTWKDSPQPQRPFSLGLRNTKRDWSLSTTKSISVPRTKSVDLRSMRTVTPPASTTSSLASFASANSMV